MSNFVFSLPPGFPDDVAQFLQCNQLAPGPSQNRAGAIYAHGSSHGRFTESEHNDLDPRFRQRVPLKHFIELCPVETASFTPTVQPLMQ